MKHIKLSFWGFLLALCGLWALADPMVAMPATFADWRLSLLNLTGIVAIGVMSLALLLAARPVPLEPFFGGLDKMYRLHKWLGITALVMSIAHWLCKQVPGWLVDVGWMARPERHRGPEPMATVLQFFQSLRGMAEAVGEWAFYATVVLLVLALIKWFPYRLFFKTHRLLAVAYLFLVLHSVVLMKFSYWGEAAGAVMAVFMLGGSVAAVAILLRRVGASRRAVGVVEQITYHREVRVLEVAVQIKGRWAGHESGQFVFVTFDAREGAHPFTISSAWTGDGHMQFLIKELGDYTRVLPVTLKVGDPVKIEGPYGQFTFDNPRVQQIWVGGGIGITPFVARLTELGRKPDGKTVDLFYATAMPYTLAIHKLRRLAHEANVRLHVMIEARDGRLTAQQICLEVPDWQSSDIWFCGPRAFGQALRKNFTGRGFADERFHEELFDMR